MTVSRSFVRKPFTDGNVYLAKAKKGQWLCLLGTYAHKTSKPSCSHRDLEQFHIVPLQT